jgi:hypothetical protein
MTSGTLHAQDTSFTGGAASGSPTYLATAQPAISNTGGSLVFIGCTVTAGGGPNFPESIVHSGPEIQASGSVFTPPPSGPLQTAAPLVALDVVPSWQLGTTSMVAVRGQPGAFYGIWLAASAPSALSLVVEPIWIDPSAPAVVVLGLLDPLGTDLVAVAVPSTPSLQYAAVMCQALSGTNLPLHASVVAGGLVR